MLESLRQWYRRRAAQPWVRPWGLATPILVLVVCLPILRPLRHPTRLSDNERQRLATIESIVERDTLAIDGSSFYPQNPRDRRAGSHPPNVSPQPPVLAALLAVPYRIMHRAGLSFATNDVLAAYLLTILGATLPVALAGGLVYRLGRIFELSRPMRMVLAMGVVFGTGLVAYATVLNSHAPAAALLLACCGAFHHALTTARRGFANAWLAMAGFGAGLAAVIDLGAAVFLLAFVLVIVAMSWTLTNRLGGILFYVLGALPPLALHAVLSITITGDVLPAILHRPLLYGALSDRPAPADELEDAPPGYGSVVAGNLTDGLIGARGLLSHFPVLLLGLAGIGTVMRRHWPAPTKMLAVASIAGAGVIVLVYALLAPRWDQPMFAVRWFILFTPLLMLWAGAWMRKEHHPATWSLAGTLLAFSVTTSLLGATAPFTPAREGEYTVSAAVRLMIRGYPQEAGYAQVSPIAPRQVSQ